MPGKPITKNSFNRILRNGRNNSKKALRKSGKYIRYPHARQVFSRPSRSNPTGYLKRHRKNSTRKNSTRKHSARKNSNHN